MSGRQITTILSLIKNKDVPGFDKFSHHYLQVIEIKF